MVSSDREPADGAAEILHLIGAARAWNGPDARWCGPEERHLAKCIERLEARYAREQPAPEPVGWHPRTWRELVAGDRVEVAGTQATVLSSVTQDWHVDPASNVYRPTGLEHSVTLIRLDYRPDEPYPMPPDGEVETLRGPAGQAIDEANGFRSALAEEPIDVMASWAQDAADTLAAAGLGPVEVIRAEVDDTCHCSRSKRMYCHSSKCHGGADIDIVPEATS